MYNFKGLVDGKVIDDRAAFAHAGVADSAACAIANKVGSIFVHVGPMVAEADAMECMI